MREAALIANTAETPPPPPPQQELDVVSLKGLDPELLSGSFHVIPTQK